MASIGQKLEEARNRKGISIREAEEATKIRGHFLASFEKDVFDVDLPPVYLSGFLKNYARFLGLDPEAVLAELDVLLPSRSGKTAKKSLEPFNLAIEIGFPIHQDLDGPQMENDWRLITGLQLGF